MHILKPVQRLLGKYNYLLSHQTLDWIKKIRMGVGLRKMEKNSCLKVRETGKGEKHNKLR